MAVIERLIASTPQGDLLGGRQDEHPVGQLEAGEGDLIEAVGQVEHDMAEVPPQHGQRGSNVIAGDGLTFFGTRRGGEDAQ